MHTVVFGWFGVSSIWFAPLAVRLALAAMMRESGARGRGKIRLGLGFAGVLIGSGSLEAALAPQTGNALGHALLGASLHVLGRGSYFVLPALMLASLPWLLGFRWRDALRWADRAFGLGLNMRSSAPSHTAASAREGEPRAMRGAGSSVVRTSTTNVMAPKSTGRYARPTVWQPPVNPRTGASVSGVGSRDARAANGRPTAAANTAPGAATRSRSYGPANVPARTASTPVYSRAAEGGSPASVGYAGLRATQASAAASARAGTPPGSKNSAPATAPVSQPRPGPTAQPRTVARPQTIQVQRAPSFDAGSGSDATAERSPGVLETLRAIEANAAQWTALASSSLARRGAATVQRMSEADPQAGMPAAPAGSTPSAADSHSPAAHETDVAPAPQTPDAAVDEQAARSVFDTARADNLPEHHAAAPVATPSAEEAVDHTAIPVGASDRAEAASDASDAQSSVESTAPWMDHDAPDPPGASVLVPETASPPARAVLTTGLPSQTAALPPTHAFASMGTATVANESPTASAAPQREQNVLLELPSAPKAEESRPAEPAATPSTASEPPSITPEPTSIPTPIQSSPPSIAAAPDTVAPVEREETTAEPAVRSPLRGHGGAEFTFHAPAASAIELPNLDLLDPASTETEEIPAERLAQTGQLIEQRLQEFKVPVTVVGASAGPVITRFEIEPALGVRGSQIVGLMKDLSRGLGLTSIRVVETIPGKTCMGLELPNAKRQTIALSEILAATPYRNSASKLTLAMGKDITGHPVVTDLAKAPHMLVAGTTGSGKSVAINAMIVSLLFKATPEEVRLIMIDPKMLELSVYEGIPHLLAPVVTDMKLAANALNWCVGEMEKRYRLMSAVGVRNLAGFNQKLRDAQAAGKKIGNPFSLTPEAPEPLSPLPLIVVVIDELADLMMVAGKKIEELIARLAQKARAAGIHLILATQRPSVDVITGLIKANIPTRVAFQVSSKIDSRTILDQMGAESLLGQGDMLFLPPGTGYPQRVHGAFVSDEEVHRVVEYLKQFGEPEYEEGILDGPATEGAAQDLFGDAPDAEADPLYDEAVAFVVRTRRASISAVQRQLRIGYNRAARLVEQMEAAGLVSSMGINGSREVLAPPSSEP